MINLNIYLDKKIKQKICDTIGPCSFKTSTLMSLARPGVPDLARMERQREAKVARYRQQKATEARLLELSKAVKVEHVDEEVKVSDNALHPVSGICFLHEVSL